MTQVKICGLSTPATVDAAVAAGADHLGFVFFPRSPRDVTPEVAAALIARAPQRVGKVGVFVSPDDAMLEAAMAAGLTTIQLHGVDPARANGVRRRLGVPVWAAVAVRGAQDVASASVFRGVADRVLFDAKAPEGGLPGGNGLRFDWRLLSGVDVGMDWVLSGGLDAATVGEAIRTTRTPTVDVSSGVEDAPGVKSVAKIAAFVEAVRRS